MSKRATKLRVKPKGEEKPKTQKEKLERLEKINPQLRGLIDTFDLEVNL